MKDSTSLKGRLAHGAAFTLAFLSCSCGDPLKTAQRLEEPRILGVRVAGENGSASLEPNASAGFEVLVAGPRGSLEARFGYELCEAAESVRGVPQCAGTAFARGTADLVGMPVPVDVPASPASRLALLGVACVSGEPEFTGVPLEWGCSGGGGDPLRVSFDVHTRTEQFENENPDLSELQVTAGDTELALDEPRAQARCDDDTPELAADTTHSLLISLRPNAREELGDSRETLQLSHFSTRGLFERQFSFIDPGARALRTEMEWLAPRAAGPVKQYLVVRDERGGVSWASWTVCVR